MRELRVTKRQINSYATLSGLTRTTITQQFRYFRQNQVTAGNTFAFVGYTHRLKHANKQLHSLFYSTKKPANLLFTFSSPR